MKISKAARREAKTLHRTCLVNGRLDEHRVRQAVQQVIAQKPRGYVAILSHFRRLVKLEVERRSARVESPAPLDAPFQATIQNNLSRLYGAGLDVAFVQNPALLGGLRIQVGSDVYDGSIQAKLTALKESSW
jgi:F-type H+-transporting ATPase subunit delta